MKARGKGRKRNNFLWADSTEQIHRGYPNPDCNPTAVAIGQSGQKEVGAMLYCVATEIIVHTQALG